MKIVFDRDTSEAQHTLAPSAVIRGMRIVQASGTYPLMKLEVDAGTGREDHHNRFNVYVWHPTSGWLELICLEAKDFPFQVVAGTLESCFSFMVKVVQGIFMQTPEPSENQRKL